MAIKEPKSVNRRGESRKKVVGDRSYSMGKAFIVGGVTFLTLGIIAFIAKQWGAGIVFIAGGVGCYFPYRHIYEYPPKAFSFEETGIRVYGRQQEEIFVPFAQLKRVTLFNPETRSGFLYSSRRSVFLTLKPTNEHEEDHPTIVPIFAPYDVETVYFQILQAKLDFDGVPAAR